jgi:sterol desaturase/sphingolipid hydroxylase (fatty acid hydroxylase superfamily)
MNIIEIVTMALIPAFLLLDVLVGKRRFERARWWRIRSLVVTAAIFVFATEVAALWGKVFGDYHLLNGSRLGTMTGAIVGVLVYQLAHYWYHRAAHHWDWLWRAGHQMHHSAESLDAFGAYYLHPIDAAFFTTWSSLVFFPLLGLSIKSALLATFFLSFNTMFQHANIATPHWLGYLIQRPESHIVHHARGVHRYNYADLPIIDMLFGTFRNPKTLKTHEVGFYTGASSRIFEMMIGKDVSTPPSEEFAPASQTLFDKTI